MSKILIPGQICSCPLCDRRFDTHKKKDDKGVVHSYYVCPLCRIAININDKMIGRWSDSSFVPQHGERTDCDHCGTEMRFFCRSDGYVKTQCPKCFFALETGEEPAL